jgi:glutathione-specific gamma-glutamylcyclotransferase
VAALPLDGIDGAAAITATTWIATPDNPYHLGPASLEIMVAQIRVATGPSGANVEYVLRLAEALRAMAIIDPHIDELARALGT